MASSSLPLERALRATVRDVPDFPKPGIVFRDITPVLADPTLFAATVDGLAQPFAGREISHVVGIESRGFILGAPVALVLGAAFVPVRKPGKLPYRTRSERYALEYGADQLEIHEDACPSGARVLVVDDVLATGGTASATLRLIAQLGAAPVGCAFLIELPVLGGRSRLGEVPVHALLRY